MTETGKRGSDTEAKLLQLIASHAVEHPGKKIRRAELAAAAGITRQALHRYYGHLEPYISGERTVSERLDESGKDAVLLTGMERLTVLEAELKSLKASQAAQIEKVRAEYTTSLMKSDLALHDVDGLRARLEAQSLHNDILINQIKSLEASLTAAKLEKVARPSNAQDGKSGIVRPYKIDLKRLFADFDKHGDREELGREKLKAVQAAIARARKSTSLNAKMVIFIDRFLCSIDVVCRYFEARRNENYDIIQVPIFSSLQLKTLVFSRLDPKASVSLFLPYCESKSIEKAQRAFYFSFVPETEIAIADKISTAPLNIIDSRIKEIVSYKVAQGE